MFTAHVVTTILAAAANGWAAWVDFARPTWLLTNMGELGIGEARLPTLGLLKAAGAAGLLVGVAVPAVGLAAGVALIAYFLLAVGTTVRAHAYQQIPYPSVFLALAAASTVSLVASA
jgi:hypothetical protein